MDDRNKFVDLSSYLLFEDTGDSDETADDDSINQLIKHDSTTKNQDDEDAANDAMSCSSDLSDDDCLLIHNHQPKRKRGLLCQLADEDGVQDEDEDEDEDEGVVNQAAFKKAKQKHQESNNNKNNVVCGDPTMKLICQREQDKLFWEACLASS